MLKVTEAIFDLTCSPERNRKLTERIYVGLEVAFKSCLPASSSASYRSMRRSSRCGNTQSQSMLINDAVFERQ